MVSVNTNASARDIRAEGCTMAGCCAQEVRAAGCTMAGCCAQEVRAAGWTMAGCCAQEVRAAGWTMAGCCAQEVRAAGRTMVLASYCRWAPNTAAGRPHTRRAPRDHLRCRRFQVDCHHEAQTMVSEHRSGSNDTHPTRSHIAWTHPTRLESNQCPPHSPAFLHRRPNPTLT